MLSAVERVRITQIDLVLAWTRLMMRVFHRNAHLFEHVDGGAAEVHAWAARHMVEIAALIDWGWRLGPIILSFEQIEFDFRMHVEGEAFFLGFRQSLLQHMTRIAQRRLAIRGKHVAEHARGALRASTPRQNLECRRVGLDDHIVFRCDSHGLQRSQHIREPQTNEAHVAFFDCAQSKLLLFIHSAPSFHAHVTKVVNTRRNMTRPSTL